MDKVKGTIFPGGYHGKILRVNLSEEKIWEEPLDQDMAKNNIGGTGFAMYFLEKYCDPKKDAFDESTPVIFAVGPLTATNAPSSGAYVAVSKSPLNGMVARGQSNGLFGAGFKACGYDAIIITGKAKRPSYLWITDDNAELRDASGLWGLNNNAAEDAIIAETFAKARVVTIGRAGENMVKSALLQNDRGHVASSGGIGAVMGSKNLKAVAAYGTKKTKLADEATATTLIRTWFGLIKENPVAQAVGKMGTAFAVGMFSKLSDIPTRNLTTTQDAEYNITPQNIRAEHNLKTKNCYKCPVSHTKWVEMPEGNKYGLNLVEEPEYEGLAGFGPNICVKDPVDNLGLNAINDDFGMDYKTLVPMIGLCIECYEEGILTPDRCDGLELKWGNADAVAELIKMVANNEGNLGKALASRNIKEVAEWIGGDAMNRAVFVKGGGIHQHDYRALWGYMVAHATSDFTTTHVTAHLSMGGAPEFGFDSKLGFSPEGYGYSAAKLLTKGMLDDFSVVCNYCSLNGGLSVKMHLELISAITGIQYDYENTAEVMNRAVNRARVFNILSGIYPVNEMPSERLMSAPVDGVAQGVTIKPHIKGILEDYHVNMGWDKETGYPLPETLQALGLEYNIPHIWK